jgi:predicted transcriptional regulator
MSLLKGRRKTSNNILIKSPRLKGEIVETILLSLLLHPRQKMSVSELLFQTNRKLHLASYRIVKKYFVYLADYELISYNGQNHVYQIEDNGIDLLYWIVKEKKRLMISDSKDITITIEERGD